MESEAHAVDQESLNKFPDFILGFCVTVSFIVWFFPHENIDRNLIINFDNFYWATRFISWTNNLTHFIILRSIWRVVDMKLFKACNSLEMLLRNFLGFCRISLINTVLYGVSWNSQARFFIIPSISVIQTIVFCFSRNPWN